MTELSETSTGTATAADDYYTRRHEVAGDWMTIYGIWESGGAMGDSVTPSTYVEEYRSHIVLKMLSLTEPGSTVFSLGCGNGFVEGDLASLDRRVRAVDVHPEAVELTRGRSVDAFVGDFFELEREDLEAPAVVYADGFLGHVFDPAREIRPALEKLRALVPPGTFVVLSNDAPRDSVSAHAPHERVPGFWFISRQYLADGLTDAGFEPLESYYFPYLRPVSGLRNRTIVVARAL